MREQIFKLLFRTEFNDPAEMEEQELLTLAALAEQLTGEEMDHLAQVAAQPESVAHSSQSIGDYISVIRGEALLRGDARPDDLLLAAQKRHQQKKAYMEEKP